VCRYTILWSVADLGCGKCDTAKNARVENAVTVQPEISDISDVMQDGSEQIISGLKDT